MYVFYFYSLALLMAAPAKHPIKTAAAPMPRAQRYKVERRAGASAAASGAWLLERWPSALAFLPLEVPASDLIAAAQTLVAARAALLTDCM